MSARVVLTKDESEEVLHKIGILAASSDLQNDYKITRERAEQLEASVPLEGLWVVADDVLEAVRGEMEDHLLVLARIIDGMRKDGETKQAAEVSKLRGSLRRKLRAGGLL